MNDVVLTSKPMDYEVVGIMHARYNGRDFYGEHASDMAELAWLRDWKCWGETEFLRLMRNHSADIAQYERPAPETGERRETGWLVEDGGHTSRYRTMRDGNAVWTDNPNEALRFARRVDAELFSREDEDAWRIVEHEWITPPNELCPHGMPLAENTCGPCSKGALNPVAVRDAGTTKLAISMLERFRDGRLQTAEGTHTSLLGPRDQLLQEADWFDHAVKVLRGSLKAGEQQ